MLKKLAVISAALLIIGCSSAPQVVTYNVEPTPLKSGKSTYTINKVSVNLQNRDLGDDVKNIFSSQEQLTQQFSTALEQEINQRKLNSETNSADANLDIHINYRRNVNLGSSALSRPNFSYQVTVFDTEGNKLATINKSEEILKGGFKENIKVLAWQWDTEDEKNNDIPTIASYIIAYVEYLGN